QWPLGTPARIRPGLPEPDPLHRQVTAGSRRIQTRATPWIVMSPLIACFDQSVSPQVVLDIARRQPLRAVFLDAGFYDDAARINAEQIFRELSPATEVKAI
ncbi:hypothetical protein, partial [Acidipropionibacterium jensenii]|uniref:hypothetical protein n=1 Tax=Acidipropionibacterium jensenii TaxID=1749 RepID=UPI00214C4F57